MVRDKIVSDRLTLKKIDMERLFKSLCTSRRYRYATLGRVREIDLGATLGVSHCDFRFHLTTITQIAYSSLSES